MENSYFITSVLLRASTKNMLVLGTVLEIFIEPGSQTIYMVIILVKELCLHVCMTIYLFLFI